jgi:shikimate kinase
MLIYLVGYIAAGKSVWGKKIAERLGYGFVDTRKIMEEKSNLNFKELLRNKEIFIDLEQKALEQVSKMQNTVVAVGEMLPCRGDNMEVLNNTGITFYLKAGVGCIMMKIGNKTQDIPLLQGIENNFIPDFIRVELDNRRPFYNKSQIIYMARELTIDKALLLINEKTIKDKL